MFSEHFSTAFTHIRRSPYQALAAILVMSLTFFVASIFAFLGYGAGITLRFFETQPQVIAFIKSDAPEGEVTRLKDELSGDQRITGEVKYVSSDEAYEIFQDIDDNPLVTELVPPDILPTSLEFAVKDLAFAKDIISQLKSEEVIERVEFTGSLGDENQTSLAIERLESITKNIRLGGVILLSFLILIATLMLIVIIGMRIAVRREEIDTLRLLGATRFFIRAPFLIEAICYSISGVFIGFLAGVVAMIWTLPSLTSYFGEVPLIPQDIGNWTLLLGILLGGEILLAILIGILGGFVALSRYLRI